MMGFSLSEVSKPIDIMKDLPKSSEMSELPTTDFEQTSETMINEKQDDSTYVICRNESLKGDVHPISGVPFSEKTVQLQDGKEVTGTFPEFDSTFDAQLDQSQYLESDAKQFKIANSQLKEGIETNDSLKKEFTEDQLEQIKEGDTPDGYVWHHSEEPGTLQLVDTTTHAQTGHTGGRSIWGGGSDNR